MATTFNQTHFRARNDDGTEVTATWKAATDANWSQAPGITFRVRFACTQSGSTAATLTGQLQVQKNAAGFNNVTGSSSVVKAVTSSNITDDQATTQIISSGTFVAGKCDINDGVCAATASMATSTVTELEFALQINAADVTPGDTVQLRVIRAPSTAFTGTYLSPTVNLTVTKSPTTVTEAYAGQGTKFTVKMPPATVAEVYAAATPKAARACKPATLAESYSAATPALKSTRKPATVTETYAAATASLKVTIKPAVTTESYAGLTAALKTTLKPAVVTESYAAQTPVLGRISKPTTAAEVYAAATPTVGRACKPSQIAWTYALAQTALKLAVKPAVASEVYASFGSTLLSALRPSTASETYASAAAALKVVLRPGTVTESYADAATSSNLSLHPATVAESYASMVVALKSILHPGTIAATFTGAGLTFQEKLSPAISTAVFDTATPTVTILPAGIVLQPAAGSEILAGLPVSLRSVIRAEAASAITGSATLGLKFGLPPGQATHRLLGEAARLQFLLTIGTAAAIFGSVTILRPLTGTILFGYGSTLAHIGHSPWRGVRTILGHQVTTQPLAAWRSTEDLPLAFRGTRIL